MIDKSYSLLLKEATEMLTGAGIATARLDAQILLSKVTGKDRAWLLTHGDTPSSAAARAEYLEILNERCLHVPIAYITGTSEFYGRSFFVDTRVLVPRPESEAIIDVVKDYANGPLVSNCPLVVIDIGTGSGCLAITTAKELPAARVMATDSSVDALAVAQKNAHEHTAKIEFFEADWLLSSKNEKDIRGDLAQGQSLVLLCNLPYVPLNHAINDAAKHEPRSALFAGKDGLDAYRELFEQLDATKSLLLPELIVTESLLSQHDELKALAARHHYAPKTENDLVIAFGPILT